MKNGNYYVQLRRAFYSLTLIGGLIVMAAMITAAVHAERSASYIANAAATQSATAPPTNIISQKLLRSSMFQPPLPVSAETVATYAADCSTPRPSFSVGDTVCVKTSGVPLNQFVPRRLMLTNSNSTVVFSANITSDPQTDSFTLDATSNVGAVTVDNRGTWQAVVLNPFFFFHETSTSFSVADPNNATADIGVSATAATDIAQAGAQVIFELQVKSYGPNNSA